MYAKKMYLLGLVVLLTGLVLFGCSGTPQTEQYKVTVTITGQGSVIKTPDQATYDANSSVKLEATPNSGWSFKNWSGSVEGTENPVTVVVDSDQTITAVFEFGNAAPVLAPIGNKAVQEGATLTFTVTASDANEDTLTLSVTNVPTGAIFTAATGVFSWTPTAAQNGNYTVTFKVSDGELEDSEEITISVGDVNQPPVLSSIGNKTVNEAEMLTFKVTASDPDGDTLTYSVTDAPEGAAFNTATGDFSWTPTREQSDSYTVIFAVSDGTDEDSETITIEVVDVPLPEKIIFSGIYHPNNSSISTEDIYCINTDGTNIVNLTNTASYNDRSPDCSPDGSKIVFTSVRGGKGEIFVMNADGSNPVNLTNSATYDDYSPAWSPDGTKIAFVSTADGGYPQIYVMNADGSNPVNLSKNSEYNIDPDWSPDGSKIVFASSLEGYFDIFVMNADGTNPVNISKSSVRPKNPAWSPDGTKIAYTGNGDGYRQEVFVMNADGSNQVSLTADLWAEYNDSPAWSPDSSKIVFDAKYHIYIMNADGSNKTDVTSVVGGGLYWQPSWMPKN